MKYLYYIAGIMVLFSAWAMYTLFSGKVEISKPALVINDQVISRAQLDEMLESQSYRGSYEENLDQLITRQLLIQEAVRQEINKEESFRRAVQNYYEQSLIKILMDRQDKTANIHSSQKEIEKYKSLSKTHVVIVSLTYKDEASALKGSPVEHEEKIESDFLDLPDHLRFMVFSLGKGGVSAPFFFETGVWVYEVADVVPMGSKLCEPPSDEEIQFFLRDHKKNQTMDAWIQQLRKKATIWREDES